MKYRFLVAVLLWGPLTAFAEANLDEITERVIELLQKDVDVEGATGIEEEIPHLVLTAKFDPVPLAFHRQYVDQISDFREGRVIRTYYDYLGSVTRREEKQIDQKTLRSYVASLVGVCLKADSVTALPEFVRVNPAGIQRTEEAAGDGNEG